MKKIILALIAASVCHLANAQTGIGLPITGGYYSLSGTVPSNGTNEVQQFTLSSTGTALAVKFGFQGNFGTLSLSGTETQNNIASLALNAIGGMKSTGTANVAVSVSGTASPVIQVTFQNALGKLNVPQLSAVVTSGTVTVTGTTSTPGVTADGRDLPKNAVILDQFDSAFYINTSSTTSNPNWHKFSQ